MRTYRFDIYVHGRYKTTLVTKAPPKWVFTEDELVGLALIRFPSLTGQKWSFN